MIAVRYKIEHNYNEYIYYIDQIIFDNNYYWVILLAPASNAVYLAYDGTTHEGISLVINKPKSLYKTPEKALVAFNKIMNKKVGKSPTKSW